MASSPPSQLDTSAQLSDLGSREGGFRNFPWWLVGLVLVMLAFAVTIITGEDYRAAFLFIIGEVTFNPQTGTLDASGIALTIVITLGAFFFAVIIGLLAGLGRVSGSVVLNNLATFYVELIRGIPMVVLIFTIAFVTVPGAVALIQRLGEWLAGIGIPNTLAETKNDVSFLVRAVIALSVTYGAFLAEIFRAGIQSISAGQMEAARSLGMSYGQAMWHVILPQAIRNVLPALGNDFIAMLKDSSLVSVLAVRETTQLSRLYASASFQFPEAYTTLSIIYLTMTVVLSLILRMSERRLRTHA